LKFILNPQIVPLHWIGFHGSVLALILFAPFNSSTSWDAFDAGNIDGLNTLGYQGGVFDHMIILFPIRILLLVDLDPTVVLRRLHKWILFS